jgi:hypothetical protein
MENKDKGLTVPKWVLISWQKIPPMPQNLSAQFVCPSPKVLDFNKKKLHWVSVVRMLNYGAERLFQSCFFILTGKLDLGDSVLTIQLMRSFDLS